MAMNVDEHKLKALFLPPDGNRWNQPLDVLGERGLVKLAGPDSGGSAAIVRLEVPKLSGPPLHRHTREDEWFYVLSGQITWQVEGERFTGGAGSSAFAPRGTAHTFQNFHDETAQILVMVTPGGLERFFEDVTVQNQGLAQPDFAKVEALMNEYGLELLGPPLS